MLNSKLVTAEDIEEFNVGDRIKCQQNLKLRRFKRLISKLV